ncbi:MAG: hypothetical protein ACXIVQ_06740 [Acidimicrobiales bacterium]
MGRLGFSAKRNARVPAAITSALVDDGEVVEHLVQGTFHGKNAVLALTDRRLLVVNDREWRPDVRTVTLGASTQVQGFGDDRTAALTIIGDGDPLEVTNIGDPALAREMAQRIRARVGG